MIIFLFYICWFILKLILCLYIPLLTKLLYTYFYYNIYIIIYFISSMYLSMYLCIYVSIYFARCPIRIVRLLSAIYFIFQNVKILSFSSWRFSYRILHSSALVKSLCSLDLWQSGHSETFSHYLSIWSSTSYIPVFLFLNFLS